MRWRTLSILLIAGLALTVSNRVGHQLQVPTEIRTTQREPDRRLPYTFSERLAEANDISKLKLQLEESKKFFFEKESARASLEKNPHATPPSVMKAALVLGEVTELEKKHPEAQAEFILFYQDCFKSPDALTVTRVQCLRHYMRSQAPDEEQKKQILASLPHSVQKLYQRSEPRAGLISSLNGL